MPSKGVPECNKTGSLAAATTKPTAHNTQAVHKQPTPNPLGYDAWVKGLFGKSLSNRNTTCVIPDPGDLIDAKSAVNQHPLEHCDFPIFSHYFNNVLVCKCPRQGKGRYVTGTEDTFFGGLLVRSFAFNQTRRQRHLTRSIFGWNPASDAVAQGRRVDRLRANPAHRTQHEFVAHRFGLVSTKFSGTQRKNIFSVKLSF